MNAQDDTIYMDQEEREMMQSMDEHLDKYGPRKDPQEKQQMAMLRAAAENHSKKKSISLRVLERNLRKIKVKAMQKGIPYQTYINMLINDDVQSMAA